jgi:DNA-binding NarL/FixJ family response regulator
MSASTSPIRLLLVDDHQLILDSLQTLLLSIPDVEVVATLNDSRRVPDVLAKRPIDLILSDLHMPHLSGLEMAMQVRRSHPALKVLLLTMAEDSATVREAMQVGVAGYVLKRAGRDELETAIRTVMNGQRYYSPALMEQLTCLPHDNSLNQNPFAALTEREVDVLKLIAEELPTTQIAEKLFVSIPTVETHRRHLMQKLNVKSVVGMVKFAMKHGLVV